MGYDLTRIQLGIFQNIQEYLQANHNGATIGDNWMQLTYKPGRVDNANRNDACKDISSVCAFTKSNLWPVDVYESALSKGKGSAYMTMSGYSDSISCDELPFNASKEGGTGANAQCVTNDEQTYQARINLLLTSIYDIQQATSWNPRNPVIWNGGRRLYTMNLFDSTTNGNNIGSPYAGTWSSSANTPASGLTMVLGGINLQDNPQYQLGVNGDVANGVCISLPQRLKLAVTKSIYSYALTGCFITFETPEDLTKRGLDPTDPQNWVITCKSDPIICHVVFISCSGSSLKDSCQIILEG